MGSCRLHHLLDEHVRVLTSLGSRVSELLQPGPSEAEVRAAYESRGIRPPREAVEFHTWREAAPSESPSLFFEVGQDTFEASLGYGDYMLNEAEEVVQEGNFGNDGDPDWRYWRRDYISLGNVFSSQHLIIRADDPLPRPVYFYQGGGLLKIFNSLEEAVQVATYGLLMGWYWVDSDGRVARYGRWGVSEHDLVQPPYRDYPHEFEN